jgi:hypothetical protein
MTEHDELHTGRWVFAHLGVFAAIELLLVGLLWLLLEVVL